MCAAGCGSGGQRGWRAQSEVSRSCAFALRQLGFPAGVLAGRAPAYESEDDSDAMTRSSKAGLVDAPAKRETDPVRSPIP